MSFLEGDVRDKKKVKVYPTDGYGVYGWPEFKAFMDRLGFPYDQPTTKLTIVINMDECVRIIHQYLGQDVEKSNHVDTTNLHNEEFRTAQPVSKLEQ